MSLFSWLFPKIPAPPAPQTVLPPLTPAVTPQPTVTIATAPSEALMGFLAVEEGFSANAYWDVSGWAVGYGSHVIDGQPVTKTTTVTKPQALNNLRILLQQCCDEVRQAATPHLSQQQLDSLADFVYNVGIGGFQSSTILKTINANGTVTEAMFTVWSKTKDDSGALVTSPDLYARRQKEFQIWANGVYTK